MAQIVRAGVWQPDCFGGAGERAPTPGKQSDPTRRIDEVLDHCSSAGEVVVVHPARILGSVGLAAGRHDGNSRAANRSTNSLGSGSPGRRVLTRSPEGPVLRRRPVSGR